MSRHDPAEKPPVPPTNAVQPTGQFGKMLRTRRRALDLTLEALSQATGWSVSMLSLLESGKRMPPELSDARRLAAALQWQPDSEECSEFLQVADAERSVARRRRGRPGIVRELVQINSPVPRRRKRVPGRGKKKVAEASPVAETAAEPRSAVLSRALTGLLELELREGIQSLQILTRTGKQYLIPMDTGEE